MLFNKENFNETFPEYFEKELHHIFNTLNYFGYFETEKKPSIFPESMKCFSCGYVIVFRNPLLGLEVNLDLYIREYHKNRRPGAEEFNIIQTRLYIYNNKDERFHLDRYLKNKNIHYPGIKVDENVIENIKNQLNLIQVTLMKDLAPMLRGETFIDHSDESLQDYYDALTAAELNPEQEAIDEYLKNKNSLLNKVKRFFKK